MITTNISRIFNQITSPFLDFLYPPICIACRRSLPDGKEKVCRECWNRIPLITREHPLYQETSAKLLQEGAIKGLVSCFVFEKEGPFQHIAHALKYQEYKSLGFDLGRQIGLVMHDWSVDTDFLIPIPLHRIKFRERGYNQAELIARGIASVITKPVVAKGVRRVRYTQTQTKLDILERRRNMEEAFEINPEMSHILHRKRCLLVDDVITTGATTNSCAKALLKAGVLEIVVASAAIAQ